ncbi:TRAP transporter small permease [Aquibaculum sediminis]|uniref:TRAP transporter small permease n=1 Tax=Aquibaculum sediminis TaxID=3231907 RepID=UPI003454AE3E
MLVHAVADIATKYFLGYPIPATIEITAYYYMVAAVFLPLLRLELLGQHVVAEVGYNLAGPRLKKAMRLFAHACVLIFLSLLAYRTGHDAVRSYSISEISMGTPPIPLWPAKCLLPLGFGVAAVGTLFRICTEIISAQPSDD